MFHLLLARADADRQVHQAQALWSACSALWSSMRNFSSNQPFQLKPLKAEVDAVKRAAGNSNILFLLLPQEI